MHLVRITPPAVLPLSLAEAKALARLDGVDDEDDAVITAFLRSAVERVDGPDGEIQRALITQVWELRLDRFPGTWPQSTWPARWGAAHLDIEIPLPPLQSVVSVTYVSGGADVVLASSDYYVAGVGDRFPARLRPVTYWPQADDITEAVKIQFVCGYGDDWNSVPELIRHAIALMVQEAYDGCESEAAKMLLRPYRVALGLA